MELADESGVLTVGKSESLSLKLKNHGQAALLLSDLSLATESSNVSIIGESLAEVLVPAGDSVVLTDHFKLFTSEDIDTDLTVLIQASATTNGQQQSFYQQFHPAVVNLELSPPLVMDHQNQRLDPGEETDLVFQLYNSGLASAGILSVEAFLDDPYAAITTSDSLITAPVNGLSIQKFSFGIKLNEAAPGFSLARDEYSIRL